MKKALLIALSAIIPAVALENSLQQVGLLATEIGAISTFFPASLFTARECSETLKQVKNYQKIGQNIKNLASKIQDLKDIKQRHYSLIKSRNFRVNFYNQVMETNRQMDVFKRASNMALKTAKYSAKNAGFGIGITCALATAAYKALKNSLNN